MSRAFNGVDTYITYGGAQSAAAFPLSYAVWFYPFSLVDEEVLCGFGDVLTADFTNGLVMDGTRVGDPLVAVSRQGGTAREAVTTNGFIDNKWNHACGLFVGQSDRISVLNGDVANLGQNTQNANVTELTDLRVGASPTSTPLVDGVFNGALAHFAAWRGILTDREIETLCNPITLQGFSPLLVRPQDLVIYIPLLGGDGDVEWMNRLVPVVSGSPTQLAVHPSIIMPGTMSQVSPDTVATFPPDPLVKSDLEVFQPPQTGAGMDIGRITKSIDNVNIDGDVADCTEIDCHGFTSGEVVFPSTYIGGPFVEFHVHFRHKDDSPLQLFDTLSAPVQIANFGNRTYGLPDQLFGARSFRMKSPGVTNQTARVVLKS